MRLIITFFVLLFTQLTMNLIHAAPQKHISVRQSKHHPARTWNHEGKKRLHQRKKTAIAPKKSEHLHQLKHAKNLIKKEAEHHSVMREQHKSHRLHATGIDAKKREHRGQHTSITPHKIKKTAHHKSTRHAFFEHHKKNKKINTLHQWRYHIDKKATMTKLMHQVGKPYRWGGDTPRTGFDCSGLVYYAYKDSVKIKMPRTANEMYHLRSAISVKKNQLEKGDLVFFHIHHHDSADHVGVYLGNGKFIHSPRTGEDIRISQLYNRYWEQHYLGAKRVMTLKTAR